MRRLTVFWLPLQPTARRRQKFSEHRVQSSAAPASAAVNGIPATPNYHPGGDTGRIRMADLPAGEVDRTAGGSSVAGCGHPRFAARAAARRGDLASTFDDYGNILRGVRTAHLETQDGRTAEEIRQAFRRGETRAREISAASDAKQKAYRSRAAVRRGSAHRSADIAAAGNAAIGRILDSEGPAAQKVSAIVETVTAAQLDANSRAAMHSAGVFDAIQSVLDAHGETSSAREFARNQRRRPVERLRQPRHGNDPHQRRPVGEPTGRTGRRPPC